jgi:CSLREA domain-containing protein
MKSRGRAHRAGVAAAAALLSGAAGLAACQLPGHQFTVTTTADGADAAPGDGVCEMTPGAGDCSLRAAIMEANAESGSNDIEIGDGHVYALGSSSSASDLVVTDSVSINGASTISAGGHGRVFDVQSGGLIVSGSTIRDGSAASAAGGGVGGGIHVGPAGSLLLVETTVEDNTAIGDGGAIFNEGRTTISSSHVTDNQTEGGPTFAGHGGAVSTTGSLSIMTSTLSGDSTTADGNFAIVASSSASVSISQSTLTGNLGGVISTDAPLTVDNSTISFNNASPSGPAAAIDVGAAATFTASTIAANDGNPANAAIVAIANHGAGTVTVSGTVIAQLVSCRGTVQSGGYNVVSDSSCSFRQVGDKQGFGAQIQGLADNGGPTQTMLPLAASPLVDAIPVGTPGLCDSGATDQRGVPRPSGPQCDIGAVEGHA